MSQHLVSNCSDAETESRLRYSVGSTRAFFTPTIVALGVLGNALTIAIFILEARLARWNRFGVWCVALAASDTSVLISSGFLDDFLGRGLAHVYGREVVKLDTSSRASCKLLEYIQNTTLFASSYLLVIFSTDRLLTVWQPIRLMTQRYVKQSALLVLLLVFMGLILNCPVLWVYELKSSTNAEDVMSRSCRIAIDCLDSGASSQRSSAEYVIYFKAFGMFVVPCLLQAGLSLGIIAKLVEVKRLRRELMPSAHENELEMSRYYANLAVSVAFCTLVGPLCVVIVVRSGCGICSVHDTCWCHTMEQAAKLLDSVKDVSYSINFWVYLLFVRSFRRRVALALAFTYVKLRLNRACPNCAISLRAVEMVDRLEMKRNPGAFLTLTQQLQRQASPMPQTRMATISGEKGSLSKSID